MKFFSQKDSEFPGLDEIIKLSSDSPALDPLIIEEVYYSKLDWEIDKAINTIKYRLSNAGFNRYEMAIISHPDLPLMLKETKEIKSIDEENLPPKTIYILTTKIEGRQVITPLDKITWQEFFIRLMLGKQPKLKISPMWAQARISWK